MAGAEAELFPVSVNLLVVEEFFDFTSTNVTQVANGTFMAESLWSQMPQELLETVLLFLPSPSQARFLCVCKRWKQVITCVKFQEDSSSIAFRRGYPLYILGLGYPGGTGGRAQGAVVPQEELCNPTPLKVRTVEFPGLMVPAFTPIPGDTKLSVNGGLLALAWSSGRFDEERREVRIWLLDLARQTWQELPPLVKAGMGSWNLWLVAQGKFEGMSTFQVLAVVSQLSSSIPGSSFHSYSSTDTDWREVACPEGLIFDLSPERCCPDKSGYLLWESDNQMWRWEDDFLISLPAPPSGHRWYFTLLSDSDTDAVFGYEDVPLGRYTRGFRLFKLEGSCRRRSRRKGAPPLERQWKCVLDSGLLSGYELEASRSIVEAKIVGNMVLMVVSVEASEGNECIKASKGYTWLAFMDSRHVTYHILAYHILDNSCQLLQLPPTAWKKFSGCYPKRKICASP